MFTNTKLQKEIDSLNELLHKNASRHADELTKVISESEYRVSKLKEQHKDELARIASNHDVVLQNHTAVLEGKLTELNIKTQTQAKEIEMYMKAFENLGFDVKDMKEILNKLVDGLIAKNEIKLVK